MPFFDAKSLIQGDVYGDEYPVWDCVSALNPNDSIEWFPVDSHEYFGTSGESCDNETNLLGVYAFQDEESYSMLNLPAEAYDDPACYVPGQLNYDACLPYALATSTVTYHETRPSSVVPIATALHKSMKPARITFSGKAFPGAKLTLSLIDIKQGPIAIANPLVESNAYFEQEIISSVIGMRTYSLNIVDGDGNLGESKFFIYNLDSNSHVSEPNIIFAPTVVINRNSVAPGAALIISGNAGPGNKLEVILDGKAFVDVFSNELGAYRIQVETSKLTLGSHKIQVRQFDFESNKASALSKVVPFEVSSFAFSGIDFNNDARVDIKDWSIFLSNWSSQDEVKRKADDLNNDGKVNIGDFSIFLNSFQLAQ